MRVISLILILLFLNSCKTIRSLNSCKENLVFKTKFFDAIKDVETYVENNNGSITDIEIDLTEKEFQNSIDFIVNYTNIPYKGGCNYKGCYNNLHEFSTMNELWLKWYNTHKCEGIKYPKLKDNQFLKDNLVYEIKNRDEVEIKSYYLEQKYVKIPKALDYKGHSYTVSSIGTNAFIRSNAHQIKIPNTIKSIGSGAFSLCKKLQSINIPYSITVINDYTFFKCNQLTDIKIPNYIKSIGNSAFEECEKIEFVELPRSISLIGSSAFSGCTNIESIQIPNSVKSIGASCFSNCTNLISIDLSESLTRINTYTFYLCSSLSSIEIPKSVKYIGESAFEHCSNLKTIICDVEKPDKIVLISNAFSNISKKPILYVPSLKAKILYENSKFCKYFRISKYNAKRNKMKTFDIKAFDKNNINNEYEFVTKDFTFIHQRKLKFGYSEIILPLNSYFQTRNNYYENGNLKSTVNEFINDFLTGLYKEYDKQGSLIKKINYDAPYKFTWDDILEIIKKRKLDMDSYGFKISRNFSFITENIDKETDRPFWAITYNKSEENMLGVIIIDGITGKVIKEYDKVYPAE